MSERIKMIFSKEDVERIREYILENKEHVIEVDVHGLKARDAKTFLHNLITIDREGYDICVVHGYNHGTAIKEIIYNKFLSDRLVGRITFAHNPGMTILKIAAI